MTSGLEDEAWKLTLKVSLAMATVNPDKVQYVVTDLINKKINSLEKSGGVGVTGG